MTGYPLPVRYAMLRRLSRRLLLLLLLAPLEVVSAQNPRGTLRGAVEDPSGARVPGAGLAIQSQQSGGERTALSDSRGEFRVEDLPPGKYRLTATAPGFASASADVTVVVSEVRDISIVLQPQGLAQRVNVAAQSSSITTEAIDLASAVHQGAISSQDLNTLPLAHRSFANIAYLVPGTEPVEPSDPTKARITAVSFGGSSGLNVELSVDGGDNSDDYIGGFLQNYSPDAIQEFVVRTAQEDADTGRTTGGSVVIDTKRGTNDWHGEAAFYERAATLNARLPIDNPSPEPKQPFSRQNYIGTVGGPIRKDKIWFFSSLEYVHEDASIAYSPASITQFQALAQLATAGLIPEVNAIAVPDNAPVPFDDYLATTRFDWAQSAAFSMVFARRRGSLYDRQRSGPASDSAFDWCNLARELHELAAEPALLVQPHLAGVAHAGSQRIASHRSAQHESRLCAGLSVQLHRQHHFRVRNFRRQPIRHADYRVSGLAQPGKISIPL